MLAYIVKTYCNAQSTLVLLANTNEWALALADAKLLVESMPAALLLTVVGNW